MTLTISLRFSATPGPAQPDMSRPGPARRGAPPVSIRCATVTPAGTDALGSLLALAEPAVLLLAEAAGFGLLGKVVLATAMRTAQRVLA